MITFTCNVGRSANESGFAFAMIASSSIRTDRCGSTGIRKTLVEIYTIGTNGLEAILAEALSFDALGIVNAIEVRFTESRHVGLKIICNGNILLSYSSVLEIRIIFLSDFIFLDLLIKKKIINKIARINFAALQTMERVWLWEKEVKLYKTSLYSSWFSTQCRFVCFLLSVTFVKKNRGPVL